MSPNYASKCRSDSWTIVPDRLVNWWGWKLFSIYHPFFQYFWDYLTSVRPVWAALNTRVLDHSVWGNCFRDWAFSVTVYISIDVGLVWSSLCVLSELIGVLYKNLWTLKMESIKLVVELTQPEWSSEWKTASAKAPSLSPGFWVLMKLNNQMTYSERKDFLFLFRF